MMMVVLIVAVLSLIGVAFTTGLRICYRDESDLEKRLAWGDGDD